MFDSLKKRLKEAVEKVSRAVRDDKDDYAQIPEPKPESKPLQPQHEPQKQSRIEIDEKSEPPPEITIDSVEETETEKIIEREEFEKYGKIDTRKENAEEEYASEKDPVEEQQEDVGAAIDKEIDKKRGKYEIDTYEKNFEVELEDVKEKLHEGHVDRKEDFVKPAFRKDIFDEPEKNRYTTQADMVDKPTGEGFFNIKPLWKKEQELKQELRKEIEIITPEIEEPQAKPAVAIETPKPAEVKDAKHTIKPETKTGAEIKPIPPEKIPKMEAEIKPIKPWIKTEADTWDAEIKIEPVPDGEKKGLFSKIFEKTLTEEDMRDVMRELELALLENDVAIEVAERISSDVKKDLLNKNVRRGRIEDTIKDSLKKSMINVMDQPNINLEQMINEKEGVFTIMFLGFNGVGKTTCVAKFASKFMKFHPIVAAGDTFRAASIEQLEEHARRVGFRLVKHQYGSDSAAVIFDAKKAALAAGSKLVIADTAGRSHSNVNLMDELKKLVRVNNPDLKILVLDSITGNDIYEQSRLFNDAVGVDAIILTKADVYDKGGAALSATYTLKKPILYLGVGQEYADLKEFKPEEIVEQILG